MKHGRAGQEPAGTDRGSAAGAARPQALARAHTQHPFSVTTATCAPAAWFLRQQAIAWAALSIPLVGVALLLGVHRGSVGAVSAWATFVGLNTLVFCCIGMRRTALPTATAELPSLQAAVALFLGLAWGIAPQLNPSAPPDSALTGLWACAFAAAGAAAFLFGFPRRTFAGFFTGFAGACGGAIFTLGLEPGHSAALLLALTLVALGGLAAGIVPDRLLRIANRLLSLAEVTPRYEESSNHPPHFVDDAERRLDALALTILHQTRTHGTLEAIGAAIITTDAAGRVQYLNPAAEQLTGYNHEDAAARPLAEVLTIDDAVTSVARLLATCRRAGRLSETAGLATLRRADGRRFGIDYECASLVEPSGAFAGMVCLVHDVTERRAAAQRIAWQATHDSLTGLVNRTEFEARLQRLVEAPADGPANRHALCFIDLDNFKAINDSLGHAAGDHALRALADGLREQVRASDTLGRLGGDEFAVLLHGCALDQARLIADGLRHLVEELVLELAGMRVELRASFGVVELGAQSGTLAEVLAAADEACYRSKYDGGNRVTAQVIDDHRLLEQDGRLRDLRRVQDALRDDTLELFFQRIHALRRDCASGPHCEVRVLMPGRRDPDAAADGDDRVEPARLVTPRDRPQMLPALERWTVERAVDAILRGHPTLERVKQLFVRVSSGAAADDRFTRFVSAQLARDAAAAERLCFEITLEDTMPRPDRLAFFTATVKEHGAQVALDTSGPSGLGVLDLLRRLPVDYLRIDAGVVRSMSHSSVDYEIVLALTRIAKTQGIQTVVDGVTTVAARDRLAGLGIDYVQGFMVEPCVAVDRPAAVC